MDISQELIVNMGAMTFLNSALRKVCDKELAEKIYDEAIAMANEHPGQQGHDRIVELLKSSKKALNIKQ